MTRIEKRIAIATACGFKHLRWDLTDPETLLGSFCFGAVGWEEIEVPDYPMSNDAMHEAEESLTEDERKLFCLHLGPLTSQRAWDYIHVEPEKRAEAFLRAKNLWRDAA